MDYATRNPGALKARFMLAQGETLGSEKEKESAPREAFAVTPPLPFLVSRFGPAAAQPYNQLLI